jgi:hypothetical protein
MCHARLRSDQTIFVEDLQNLESHLQRMEFFVH